MVILPSSVTLQTPERVGARDLPEFSLRLGLTSVPYQAQWDLQLPDGAAVTGAAGAGVAGINLCLAFPPVLAVVSVSPEPVG